MKEISFFNSKKTSRILFLLSIATFSYWTISVSTNVYWSANTGAVFELLWLPMLALLFLIPIISIIALVKQKTIFSSLSFYAALLTALTLIILLTQN